MAGLRPCGGSSLLVLDQHETFGRRGQKGAELSITPLLPIFRYTPLLTPKAFLLILFSKEWVIIGDLFEKRGWKQDEFLVGMNRPL